MSINVVFDVPVGITFDYLLEPANRPEWQSSLRAIESRQQGAPHVGMRWIDVTKPGLRPQLQISAMERPRSWSEVGTWRRVHAELTLDFTEVGTGCEVRATFRISGRALFVPIGPVLGPAARGAVAADLKRASRLLSERTSGK